MATKKATRSKTPDLLELAQLLRRAAATLEADLPLLDSKKLASPLSKLHKEVLAFLKEEPDAHLVPRAEYHALRHDWLDAWSLHPDTMKQAVAALPAPASHEDVTVQRLRLLVQSIKTLGVEATRKFIKDAAAPEKVPLPEDDFGIKIDREANTTVQSWGRLPLEDFIAGWKQISASTIERACAVVGLPVHKRWSKQQLTDLHRRAQRFARNTAI